VNSDWFIVINSTGESFYRYLYYSLFINHYSTQLWYNIYLS